jgi:hypothetical protein
MTAPSSSTTSTHPHFRRIPAAALRDRYASGATIASMAAEFGIGPRGLARRAKTLGLVRGHNTKKPHIKQTDEGLFASMWRAGIGTDEIAAHFKVSGRTIINTYQRLGLTPRVKGQRPKMTIAQFFELQLGELMARQAQIEQLHLTAAEMVDKIGYKWVGAEHVRELQAGGRK